LNAPLPRHRPVGIVSQERPLDRRQNTAGMGQVHAFHEPDLYDAIALQIERENSVINHRLTWTLQLNGFLFTAVSLLGGKVLDDAALRALVAIFVPMTGLVVSVSAFMGVLAAQHQLSYLTKLWTTKLSATDPRPRPFGDRRGTYLLGTLPSLLPPGILSVVWGCLLIARL